MRGLRHDDGVLLIMNTSMTISEPRKNLPLFHCASHAFDYDLATISAWLDTRKTANFLADWRNQSRVNDPKRAMAGYTYRALLGAAEAEVAVDAYFALGPNLAAAGAADVNARLDRVVAKRGPFDLAVIDECRFLHRLGRDLVGFHFFTSNRKGPTQSIVYLGDSLRDLPQPAWQLDTASPLNLIAA